MWKPFLARSLRPLFGGRRHAVPPPCGADRILSRPYTGRGPEAGSGDDEGPSRSNRQQQKQRRHLYVVLRVSGYSFHKLNIDDALEDMNGGASSVRGTRNKKMNGGASEGSGMDGVQKLRRLPKPILHIGDRRMGPHARIHVLGSNIVITGAAYGSKGVTLVYDVTDAGKLEFAEGLPDELISGCYYDAVAAGDKLHLLDFPHYLWEALPPAGSMSMAEMAKPWTWACSGRSPMPTSSSSMDAGYRITGHALHPDGRMVFVSIHHLNQEQEQETLSLDTESGEWTHRGNWRLPFHGQGHYDGGLEAWVGVARGSHDWPPRRHDENYLCSCDVPAPLADGSTPPPAWKKCEQKLTFIEAPLIHMDHAPVLVHTANGTLCLAETASSARDAAGCRSYRNILRVTMFRPKYGKNGELVMAAAPRAARSYGISSAASLGFNGAAFWM